MSLTVHAAIDCHLAFPVISISTPGPSGGRRQAGSSPRSEGVSAIPAKDSWKHFTDTLADLGDIDTSAPLEATTKISVQASVRGKIR